VGRDDCSDEWVVMKSVSQDRWDKTKAVPAALRAALDLASEPGGGTRGLNRKALERAAGFLIYVSRAYTAMRPYCT
jgi:hypothetical protein